MQKNLPLHLLDLPNYFLSSSIRLAFSYVHCDNERMGGRGAKTAVEFGEWFTSADEVPDATILRIVERSDRDRRSLQNAITSSDERRIIDDAVRFGEWLTSGEEVSDSEILNASANAS
jgi:hypothetical protein